MTTSHPKVKLKITAQAAGYLVAAALPAVLAMLLVQHYFGTAVTSFAPVWNDEIDYWHQILTFAKNGFSGGYYTIEELPARLSAITRFGTHGPFFPMLYGSVAKVFGWTQSSGLLVNLSVITCAIAAFLTIIRANVATVLLVTILSLAFWPIQIYLPTNMQEPLHYALAFVLAALFHRFISAEHRSPQIVAALGVMLVLASFQRATWGVLFIPYFFLCAGNRSQSVKTLALIAGTATLGLFLLATMLFSAPYPENFINTFLGLAKSSPNAAFSLFASHLSDNISGFFSLHNPFQLEIVLRLQFISATAYSFFMLFGKRRLAADRREATVHICNLLILFVLILTLYDVGEWLDYRVLSPHILFSLALFAARPRVVPCAVILIISLLSSSSFTEHYKQTHEIHFRKYLGQLAYFRTVYAPLLQFRQGIDPWGNSLLVNVDSVQQFLVALPAGIGINAVLSWDRIRYPLKSTFILVEPDVSTRIAGKTRLLPLKHGVLGTLYLNLDSPGAADYISRNKIRQQ